MYKVFCDKCNEEILDSSRNVVTIKFHHKDDDFDKRLELCQEHRDELKQFLNNFIK